MKQSRIGLLYAGSSSRRQLERELTAVANPERAKSSAWFFKTGKGEYAEGDRFLGISVPVQRKIALRYRHLPLMQIAKLLASPLHEYRFVALEILVGQYEAGSAAERKAIFNFYLTQTARINNWDLVDTSAPYIAGDYVSAASTKILYKLAQSNYLWERRIAIVATLGLIKEGNTQTTFAIAAMLLSDKHVLIHKAVGWALREAGKVDPEALSAFLKTHYASLPRTALRYAIEKFPPAQRKRLLAGEFRDTPLNTL